MRPIGDLFGYGYGELHELLLEHGGEAELREALQQRRNGQTLHMFALHMHLWAMDDASGHGWARCCHALIALKASAVFDSPLGNLTGLLCFHQWASSSGPLVQAYLDAGYVVPDAPLPGALPGVAPRPDAASALNSVLRQADRLASGRSPLASAILWHNPAMVEFLCRDERLWNVGPVFAGGPACEALELARWMFESGPVVDALENQKRLHDAQRLQAQMETHISGTVEAAMTRRTQGSRSARRVGL